MKLLQKSSIKKKITLLMVLTSVIVLTIATISFTIFQVFSMATASLEELSTLARTIGINSIAALTFNDRESARKTLSALGAVPDIQEACLFTPNGKPFARYESADSKKMPLPEKGNAPETDLSKLKAKADQGVFEGFPFFDNAIDVFENVYLDGETVGSVWIKKDMSGLYRSLGGYALIALSALLLTTVIAYLLALKLQPVVSRPIISLANTMERVSSRKDYSIRAVKETEDELGTLIDGFNEMLKQIQVRDDELEKHRANLEEQVALRTEELSGANTELEETVEMIQKAKEAAEAARQELVETQAQLVQSGKLASIGELASGVAHELNQPLMVIRGTAQLVRRGLGKNNLTSNELAEQLEPIDRNSKRMMNIINHLRTFSRQSKSEFQQVDVNHIIEESFLLVGEQFRLRNIEVKKDLNADLPKIKGDANQLEQVILNLITNARDAVEDCRLNIEDCRTKKEENRGKLEIITRFGESPNQPFDSAHGREPVERQSQSFVEILVRDNGDGIPVDKVDKIFDPFFTTKEVGKGTGLGLSISYGIIKDHKGEIEVAETGPEGTTFRIRLPI